MSGCPKVRVGHLPDPYQLDAGYAGGTPIGGVDYIEVQRPGHGQQRPFIDKLLGDWTAALCRISDGVGWDRVSRC